MPATPIVLICTQIEPGAKRRQHALVAGDRDDRVGVGHHRDDDRGSPSRVRGALGDFGAQVGEVSGRLGVRSQTTVGIPARNALAAIP